MTFQVKSFALAALAAAVLAACGGGDGGDSSSGASTTTSQNATYTTSFAIGDTWQIKLEGVTVNNVAKTSGSFVGTVLVGGYAAFPTGTSLTGTWSYTDGKIELKLKSTTDKAIIIAFSADQPTPTKEGDESTVLQIAKFSEDGTEKSVAAMPSLKGDQDSIVATNIDSLIDPQAEFHHVSLRFKRTTGEFDNESSAAGALTHTVNSLTIPGGGKFVFAEAIDGFYPAYVEQSSGKFSPRGLLYAATKGNVNFDYIDDTLTGMSYLVDLKKSGVIAQAYSGNWKCTSLIDPKLYAQLKITGATGAASTSVEINDFYDGKKVDGPHTEKLEANSNGLIQFKDGAELTNTVIYPISENYFIVNDETGEEDSARFLSCVPTTAQSDAGNDGGDGSSDGGTPVPSPAPPVSGADPIRAVKYDDAIVVEATEFNNSDAVFCNTDSKAYAGINTITFAENGVSDENHRAVALYAEASARYIKSKLDLDQSAEGFGDKEVISVCAKNGSITDGSGSGFYNSLVVNANLANDEVPYDQPGDQLKRLVLHEMIHVTHSRLANCSYNNYGLTAKWFSEGSALLLAGQDQYYKDDLDDYRQISNENPYDWIENGAPIMNRYPIYRLAAESLLLENGYQVDDLWKFTKTYFADNNQCDADGNKSFNKAVGDYFGVDLKNGSWVKNFWTSTLDKYALDE